MSVKRVSKFVNAPSLQHFIRQQQVVSLYRSLLVEARKISNPDVSRGIRDQIKQEFRQHQYTVDSAFIKTALVEGNRSLKQIKSMFGTDFSTPISNPPSSNIPSERDVANDTESDMRVGHGWPWERNVRA